MRKNVKKLVSRSGFTLVELVVVIAVLAILAGIGSLAYSGYITNANEAKDEAVLEVIETASKASVAKISGVSTIKVHAASGVINEVNVTLESGGDKVLYAVDSSGVKDKVDDECGGLFNTFMTGNDLTSDSMKLKTDTYKDGCHWDGTKWVSGTT